MRTGIADDGTAGTDKTYRKAYDLLADGFGPGFNGPFTIALEGVDGGAVDRARRRVTSQQALAATDGIVVRHRAGVNPGGRHGSGHRLPGDRRRRQAETETLVHTLRDDVMPGAPSATPTSTPTSPARRPRFIDISEKLSARGCRSSSPPSSACRSCC